jgi:hypothetical protein
MILLTWCSSSQTTTIINFDNLNFKLQSSKSYIEKVIDKSVYPWMVIYQESWTNTKDTFINSLIIKSQKNLNIKTKDFANKNIDSLKSSISSIVIQSTKIMSFACSWEKIIWIIKDFKITENNKDSFFSQFFFIDNNDGYIISFQSDNAQENSDFKNSLSKLSCTK